MSDRRRFARLPRLVKVTVRHAHASFDAVTMDVSPGGAFVTVQGGGLPPVGATVELLPVGASVILRGRVLRTIPHSRPLAPIAGFAVGFESIHTDHGAHVLASFLLDLGATDVRPNMFDPSARAWSYRPGTLSRALPNAMWRPNPRFRAPDSSNQSGRLARDALARCGISTWTGEDRRRAPRIATRLDARWYTDQIPSAGQVLSVSASGLFLETDHRLPPVGSRLTLDVPLPDAPPGVSVQLRTVIIRHWDPERDCGPGFGATIRHVDERGRLGVFLMWLRRQRVRQEPSPLTLAR